MGVVSFWTLCFLLTIAAYLDELPRLRVAATNDRSADGKRPVYVGAFLPHQAHPFSRTLPETLQFAVDHVNNLTGILDDFELRLRWNWTETEPGRALRIINDFVQEGPPVLLASGPIFSSVAVVVNEVMPRYDIVQITTASSTTLKDRSRFPLTVQAGGDEDQLNPPRVEFVKRMGWKRVAIIFEDNQYFRENMKNLAVLLKESDISILTIEAVKEAENSDEQLNNLKRHDARVIFSGFYGGAATMLFCKIFRADLYGPKYVWLLPGWYGDQWWTNHPDVPCTHAELHTALNLYIGFDWDLALEDFSLMDLDGIKLYPEQIEDLRKISIYHTGDYDSLITMALALNSSIPDLQRIKPPRRLDEFTYGDAEMAAVFLNHTYQTKFVGLTGKVEFTEGVGRNVSVIIVEQLKDKHVVTLAEHHSNGQYITSADTPIEWRGSRKPVDGKNETQQFLLVSHPPKTIVFILAGLGVLIALIFLTVNIHFRQKRAIKISSPQINNLIVCGCLLLYSSVVVTGMDTSGLSDTDFIILCYTKILLTCVGMSMSFGSLLVKTYRIFAIFKIAVAKFKKIDVPDQKLMFVVFLLVLLDIIIVTLWFVVGQPFAQRVLFDKELIDPINEVYVIPVLRQCGYKYGDFFTGALYGFKGIILVFGVFLAWETRKVTIKGLDDSKYITLSILIVGVTIVLAIPALQVFTNDIDLQFCVYGIAVIFANTIVLCLVFVPKFHLCYINRGVVLQTSMMNTSNTGRTSGSSRFTDLKATLQKKTSILKELVTVYRRSSETVRKLPGSQMK